MLSQAVQTRSAKPATAESRLLIDHREALIYMICEAAELEHDLMCPPQAQITPANFAWPQLVPIADLASAEAAMEAIAEQGEGPRGDWHRRAAWLVTSERLTEAAGLAVHLSEAVPPLAPVAAALSRRSDQIASRAARSEGTEAGREG